MADSSRDMLRFQELEQKRKILEKEAAEFSSILENNDNVGMRGPLIDSEGFPRSDIDLVAVRTARNRIACINTDYAELMKELEAVTARLHENRHRVSSVGPLSSVDCTQSPADRYTTPFLLVDHVARLSPAELSGIRAGDRIARFGSVHSTNFSGLSSIAEVVKTTEEKVPIPVTVLRSCDDSVSVHQINLFKPEGSKNLG
ncbi:unnamed protein product [Mesocestoides corti]|uniref:Nas2_N domain-containing protein n=1 Tax=Mesocestoides corti TaxID=53468 RepID=A0A0R3U812_MESCO|nr:unnamed protein product [Mesocestoides corti]